MDAAKVISRQFRLSPPYGSGTWYLYDTLRRIRERPSDLSQQQPEKLEQLKKAWDRYADEVGIVEMGKK